MVEKFCILISYESKKKGKMLQQPARRHMTKEDLFDKYLSILKLSAIFLNNYSVTHLLEKANTSVGMMTNLGCHLDYIGLLWRIFLIISFEAGKPKNLDHTFL